MPIRPENVARYPADWPQVRQRILDRARNRCEWCGVHNHDWGWRDEAGTFHRVRKGPLIDAHIGAKPLRPPFDVASDQGTLHIIEIILTIAHLNHQPEDCRPENLRAGCQQCHLRYDHLHHQQTAYATRREGKAVADLFHAPEGT